MIDFKFLFLTSVFSSVLMLFNSFSCVLFWLKKNYKKRNKIMAKTKLWYISQPVIGYVRCINILYKKFFWRPRSYVTILIYRTWLIDHLYLKILWGLSKAFCLSRKFFFSKLWCMIENKISLRLRVNNF